MRLLYGVTSMISEAVASETIPKRRLSCSQRRLSSISCGLVRQVKGVGITIEEERYTTASIAMEGARCSPQTCTVSVGPSKTTSALPFSWSAISFGKPRKRCSPWPWKSGRKGVCLEQAQIH